MDSTLETFAPVPRRITIADRDFDLLPLRMRQLPVFSKVVAPVVPLVLAEDYIGAVRQHYPAVAEAITIATGAEPAWLDELFPNQFLALATGVIEVNLDFFARHLLPQVRAAAGRITAVMVGPVPDGEPFSPGLPSADTGLTPA
ncbi:MAG: hypothetical protein Q7J57_05515 [Gemmobacter sp.]|nr:hypothetical protein [Gemmobacter sp.]